jgi:hypothetical protein
MSTKWKRLLNISRFTIFISIILMAVSLFFPAFVIEQEMQSNQNSERYASQTNGFTPWGHNTDLRTTVVNETGSQNNTEEFTQDSMDTYSQGWLYILPVAASTLVLFALVGSILLGALLVVYNPKNRRRGIFTYLLFFPVVFSCILLGAMFFFLIPRVVHQEMDMPRAYEPAMPLPSLGSESGDIYDEGAGSDLSDLRPLGDSDTFSYKIIWHPGPALYLYVGAFIFALFGFVFYNKMRRLKGKKIEDTSIPLVAIEEEEPVEVEISEEDEDIDVEAVELVEEEIPEPTPSIDEKEPEVEESEEPLVSEPESEVPVDIPAEEEKHGASVMPRSSNSRTAKRSGTSQESVSLSSEYKSSEKKVKKPKKVSIIELGADDFKEDKEELTIEGIDEAKVECPSCGKQFTTPLGGKIKCPYCGLEGDTD